MSHHTNVKSSTLSKILTSFDIGEKGEELVYSKILAFLNSEPKEENFFLLPKYVLKTFTASNEVDLVLLHSVFGIFCIEVKNWKKIPEDYKSAYFQVSRYKNLLLSHIKATLGRAPINIDARIIFPSITRSEGEHFAKTHAEYAQYENLIIYKDDLENMMNFSVFFKSSSEVIPTSEEFKKVLESIMDLNKFKEREIVPIISKDEVIYFDKKQASILNTYKGGLKVVRGTAGTGKTVVLSSFVKHKQEVLFNNNTLVLCFNANLRDAINANLGITADDERVKVFSVIHFMNTELTKKYHFPKYKYEKNGYEKKDGDLGVYANLNTSEAADDFQKAFLQYLKANEIQYVLIDESQDIPAKILYAIYKICPNLILFIDEGQKFYDFGISSIEEVFVDCPTSPLRGRVSNLNNVYRTSKNIAKCAMSILAKDKTIQTYYKKIKYIQDSLEEDIMCILEKGFIRYGNYNAEHQLRALVEDLIKEDKEVFILTAYKTITEEQRKSNPRKYKDKQGIDKLDINDIERALDGLNLSKVKIMTCDSAKGLEAQTVILHNFDSYCYNNYKSDIFYRKLNVLITRAREELYVSIPNRTNYDVINEVYDAIKKFAEASTESYYARNLKSSSNLKPMRMMSAIKKNSKNNILLQGYDLLKIAFEGFAALLEQNKK